MNSIFKFLTILCILCITQTVFAQSQTACSTKSFNKGEEVYLWNKNKWEKCTYDVPYKNATHTVMDDSKTRYIDIFNHYQIVNQSDFAQLDASKGLGAVLTESSKQEFRNETLNLLNNHRNSNSKGSLSQDPILQKAAQDYVDWFVKPENEGKYFNPAPQVSAHSANGKSVWQRIEIAAQNTGATATFKAHTENLDRGNMCADGAFNSWKKSPGHNNNMLHSDMRYVGIGVACGKNSKGEAVIIACTVFGGEK